MGEGSEFATSSIRSLLFSLIEGIRRRALAREVYERVSVLGIAFIVLVFVIAFSNDVSGAPH